MKKILLATVLALVLFTGCTETVTETVYQPQYITAVEEDGFYVDKTQKYALRIVDTSGIGIISISGYNSAIFAKFTFSDTLELLKSNSNFVENGIVYNGMPDISDTIIYEIHLFGKPTAIYSVMRNSVGLYSSEKM